MALPDMVAGLKATGFVKGVWTMWNPHFLSAEIESGFEIANVVGTSMIVES